jgi:hypothetical protein
MTLPFCRTFRTLPRLEASNGINFPVNCIVFNAAIRFMSEQVAEHPDEEIVLAHPEEVRGHIEI